MKTQKESNIDVLYINHAHDLYAYGLALGFDKETVMDAIHDVFYKLCSNPSQLENIRDTRFFLLRSLRNRLVDILRLKKDFTGLSAVDIEPEFTVQVTLEDEYISAEEEKNISLKVNRMLEELTDRQREIVYLRYLHGCSYEEISQIMNITVPTCHKLIHKSLAKLKENNVHLILLPLIWCICGLKGLL